MADYPCDLHLARYSGPSTRLYLNVYREEREVKLKATVCGSCLSELLTCWLERALHQTPEGGWDPGEADQDLETLWKPAAGPSGAFARRR